MFNSWVWLCIIEMREVIKKMSDYTEEELEKLKDLKTSIEQLEGIAIPFNIINRYIAPLDAWVDEVLWGE